MTRDPEDSDIERWLNEGGVRLPTSVEMLDAGVLDEGERRVIACLGAAILSVWHEMPSEIRRKVLQSALSTATYDAALLKGKVAMFLRGDREH
ncbi:MULTISPECIES: hypothetical protein [Achromobacter]|jgi:hypothetical protein|uniref:Uncharacterized protein n=1 Tax=Achromobacter denitrificans TaxID=32002 RepID=A0A6N0JMN3_ACHDE|nr:MULTISPECIES: hypothetical protein [Achromobacter]ASC68566.1 hypothetical protein B9P52_31715 [Achromobacter denitrificans]OLU06523.1 hypothetical protein BVK87_19865 [Achromobacter denitrificans]QKH40363.1 hypothetical protein FOC82_02325 [Achromobacter denitrificans]QKH52492.1 hypothetical protein FOC80_24825 [Achromobacter denitrificans]QKQ48411.1 hypothetical protein FOC81_17605 [Achromobacter denitrificans]